MRSSLSRVLPLLAFFACFPWQLHAQRSQAVYQITSGADAGDLVGTRVGIPAGMVFEFEAGATLTMPQSIVRALMATGGYDADSDGVIDVGAIPASMATDAELSAGLSGKLGTTAQAADVDPAGTAIAAALATKAATSHTHALSALTQSGATTGQVVQWNGSAWVPATPASTFDIDALTLATSGDVDDSDGLVFSDGGVEKKITLTSMRDKLQSMAWTFATLNVTTLNLTNPAALGSSTATTQPPGDNSNKVATTAYVDAAVAGVSTSGINIVSSWPGSPTAGQWYYNTAATRLRYYPNGSDYHESSAYTLHDGTAPTLSSATIPTTGDSITLAFSEAVSIGAGGNAGWVPTLTGGASAMTYSSGSGTTSLVYTLARTVTSGETGTLAYTQPGSGVEDASGNDLATIASASITNNSTVSGYTLTWSQDPTTDTTHSGATRNYLAVELKPNVDSPNTSRIELKLIKVGSPTGTIRIRVYDDASSAPTTALGDWSATVNASIVSTSEGWVAFDISGDQPDLLASVGNYFAVVDMTGLTRDASNYIGVRYNGATGTDDQDYSTDLTAWTTQDGSSQSAVRIYNSP